MRCMHGATTPWASVDRATPRAPSRDPGKWWAWRESLCNRSPLALPTVWSGPPCPQIGKLMDVGYCLYMGVVRGWVQEG